ncbi:MAG: single-stranded-DNA-specific exonuclease RecJ, partial [Oscillospiraceae bacterium]|nr:single-stranded-DNA-specific exonuclease RecJ [Oscillospiraceae bacterium]
MAIKRWSFKHAKQGAAERLVAELGVSPLAAKVLAARGLDEVEAASSFLRCGSCSNDPYELKDMDKAVQRILQAVEQGEVIAVFGDYDADGLTATTLMYRCLCSLGAQVVCALPSREGTGYGLSPETVDSLAEHGVSLIVTVDNGVSAFDEIRYAASVGIDTVVTDHHVPHERLPEAVALVNPHREDDTSAFKDLAGVGVALKVAAALQDCTVCEAVEEYGLLAAIGTIGDIMPLVSENRYIVSRGISQFAACDSPGLLALCEVAGVDPATADEGNIAYLLAPRLNAAGRMGDAELSLALLLTEDEEEARRLANELEQLNRSRREAEQEATQAVIGIISEDTRMQGEPILFISGSEFHSGVMGIVCSRLVERYNKPVIIVAIEGDSAKGSGRSTGGFSLYNMIDACSDLLEKYGGHDMAAGFTLKAELLPQLRQRMMEYCRTKADEYSLPELTVDAVIEPTDVTEASVAGLRALAPYGSGNREPVFLIEEMTISGIYLLGERHTRIGLKKNGQQFYAAVFGTMPCDFPYAVGEKIDAVLSFSIYIGHNRSSVSVKVVDLASSRFTWA